MLSVHVTARLLHMIFGLVPAVRYSQLSPSGDQHPVVTKQSPCATCAPAWGLVEWHSQCAPMSLQAQAR